MTLISNKEKQTTNVDNNRDEFSGTYAEWKKANPKKLQILWFYSYNILK